MRSRRANAGCPEALRRFQWGFRGISGKSPMASSSSPGWSVGTAYAPPNHLPRSISAQRREQNGRYFATLALRQIGQVILAPRSTAGGRACVATRNARAASSRRGRFLSDRAERQRATSSRRSGDPVSASVRDQG